VWRALPWCTVETPKNSSAKVARDSLVAKNQITQNDTRPRARRESRRRGFARS
jgi:hypothetical protein